MLPMRDTPNSPDNRMDHVNRLWGRRLRLMRMRSQADIEIQDLTKYNLTDTDGHSSVSTSHASIVSRPPHVPSCSPGNSKTSIISNRPPLPPTLSCANSALHTSSTSSSPAHVPARSPANFSSHKSTRSSCKEPVRVKNVSDSEKDPNYQLACLIADVVSNKLSDKLVQAFADIVAQVRSHSDVLQSIQDDIAGLLQRTPGCAVPPPSASQQEENQAGEQVADVKRAISSERWGLLSKETVASGCGTNELVASTMSFSSLGISSAAQSECCSFDVSVSGNSKGEVFAGAPHSVTSSNVLPPKPSIVGRPQLTTCHADMDHSTHETDLEDITLDDALSASMPSSSAEQTLTLKELEIRIASAILNEQALHAQGSFEASKNLDLERIGAVLTPGEPQGCQVDIPPNLAQDEENGTAWLELPHTSLRICGLLPWSGHLAMCYQRTLLLFQFLALLGSLAQACAANTRQSVEFRPPQLGLLSDVPLALGGLMGSVALGAYRSSGSLNSCLQDLISFASCYRCRQQWLRIAYRDLALTLILWLVAMIQRLDAIRRKSEPTAPACLAAISFAIWSFVLSMLSFGVLYFCRCLSIMIEAFCADLAEQLDPIEAVKAWNALQTMLRKVCISFEHCFFVLQTTALCAMLCMFADVAWVHSEMTSGILTTNIPAGFVVLCGLVRSLFCAASLTGNCARVPAIINSLPLNSATLHLSRRYLVEYVLHSRAGFYFFGVLLTPGAVITTFNLTLVAAIALYFKLSSA
eukprot:gnl/TRDRNA2_/TRDRNA2_176147_c0_seq1.p1 gnl/TRDRNA2_/TRDRNA2_176147_c0~~gnl/TRDRNA2_/TRDRNA2_176147_c0_seq1.p1  ORF type:complete len:754 (+),score=61.89 gnl/TRDRNA2_/TRDRNA2_176147_c0_seq1:15-2276(+)